MPAFLLNPRNWLYVAILAAVLFAGYKVYNFIYERGVESQRPLVEQARRERDEAVRVKGEYIVSYNEWIADVRRQRAVAEELAKAERDRMQAELDKANQSIAHKERNINELEEKLDGDLAHLRMPGLVVRLWNESLEGSTADAGLLGAALAGGTVGDDRTATDVTLLDLLTVGLRNNAQAVSRGMSLQEWRRYYARNKALFADHEAGIADKAPVE